MQLIKRNQKNNISGSSQPDPNGGGNFDTLEGEKELGADISFLLPSKCIPYGHYFQTGMFQPILANFFIS
jgi:hypothetical protein